MLTINTALQRPRGTRGRKLPPFTYISALQRSRGARGRKLLSSFTYLPCRDHVRPGVESCPHLHICSAETKWYQGWKAVTIYISALKRPSGNRGGKLSPFTYQPCRDQVVQGWKAVPIRPRRTRSRKLSPFTYLPFRDQVVNICPANA